jgi:hypothetical protein
MIFARRLKSAGFVSDHMPYREGLVFVVLSMSENNIYRVTLHNELEQSTRLLTYGDG